MDVAFFIFLIFLLSGITHFLLFYYLFSDVFRGKEKTEWNENTKWPSLTILICARNEEHNLEKTIPIICAQDYDDLQVVVVNHLSTDQSDSTLAGLSIRFENLRVVECNDKSDLLPGKRAAIAAGLTVAAGEFILQIDADCWPTSSDWARTMVRSAERLSVDAVAGVSLYERKSGLLNAYIQFETAQTAIMYLSAINQGRPYMAVGRNLLIKKEVIQNRLKHSVIPGVKSGDDDLLIANLSFSHKIGMEHSLESQTISIPNQNWPDYFRQKIRHMSTARYYRGDIRWLLQLFHGGQLVFIVCFILLLFTSSWWLAILIGVVRYVLLAIRLVRTNQVLNMSYSIWLLPIFEILSLIIPSVSWILSSLQSKKSW